MGARTQDGGVGGGGDDDEGDDRAGRWIALDGTFDEYVERAAGARDDVVERVPLGASSIDHSGLREKEMKEKEAPTTRKMKARCWLTRDFPLDAAAPREFSAFWTRHTSARRVNRVVKYWRDNHTGLFPIKIQVPLAFSIYAQLHFKDYATIDARRADTPSATVSSTSRPSTA